MKNSIINRQFKYSYYHVTLYIVLLNIFIYFLTSNNRVILAYLALNPVSIHYRHAYWQFITYMFTHGSFMHLFNNMFGVLIFSFALEKTIGSKEYLLFYFLTGTLSGVASYFVYLFTGQWGAFLLGASGVLYALLLLFAVFFPNSYIFILGLIPVRAPILVFIYFLIEFGSSILTRGDGISHLTHLFGLFFGYLYIKIRLRQSLYRAFVG